MPKFKVIKVTYENEDSLYYIQKISTFLGIRIRKTYREVYFTDKAGFSRHSYRWVFRLKRGTSFTTCDVAARKYRFVKHAYGWKIKSIEDVTIWM